MYRVKCHDPHCNLNTVTMNGTLCFVVFKGDNMMFMTEPSVCTISYWKIILQEPFCYAKLYPNNFQGN